MRFDIAFPVAMLVEDSGRASQSYRKSYCGLADKLDTLVSIFGVGMLPTGSSDPFALRRAANAVINITWEAEFPLNLQHC
jgi:glycyl-tRNA synthetase beta chain